MNFENKKKLNFQKVIDLRKRFSVNKFSFFIKYFIKKIIS